MNLDREKARWVISDTLMRVYDNGTSPNAAREAEAVLDALEAEGCVVPDPRLAAIAALPVHRRSPDALGWVSAEALHAILGGGPA